MRKLKKGFTLVELVVVTMLLGIIMTALVIILRPSQKYYKNITNKAFEELACITAMDVVDGELRYATNLKIVYTDSNAKTAANVDVFSLIDASKYPNYIKFDNGHRENIGKFNARGYVNKGKTSTKKAVESTLNKGTFSDYDYQFSISGINTTPKKQSLTVTVKATPMLVTASTVELDTEHEHQVDETFKLINMRHSDELGGDMGSLDIPLDEDVPDGGIIWVFYAKPVDIASNGSTLVNNHESIGDLNPGAYEELMPDFELKGEDDVDYNRIYFIKHESVHTVSPYGGNAEFKPNMKNGVTIEHWETKGTLTDKSDDTKNSNVGQVYADDYIDIYWGDDPNASIDISANQVYEQLAGTHQKVQASTVLATVTRADFLDQKVKYFYYADTYVDESVLPNNSLFLHNTWDPSNPEFGDPTLKSKTKTVHYVHVLGDTEKGVRLDHQAEGAKASVTGAIGYVECNNDADIVEVLKGSDTDNVSVSVYSGNSSSEDKLLYKFNMEADNKDEIWVCNGQVYFSADDVPKDPDPITIHYIKAENEIYTMMGAMTHTAGKAEFESMLLSEVGTYTTIGLDGNKDIKLQIGLGGDAYCILYDGAGNTYPITLANNPDSQPLSPATDAQAGNEYWLYDGKLYGSQDEVNAVLPAPPEPEPGAVPADPSAYILVLKFTPDSDHYKLYVKAYDSHCEVINLDTGAVLMSEDNQQKSIDLSGYIGQNVTLVVKLNLLWGKTESSAGYIFALGTDDYGSNATFNYTISGYSSEDYGSVTTVS